jgi:sortase A
MSEAPDVLTPATTHPQPATDGPHPRPTGRRPSVGLVLVGVLGEVLVTLGILLGLFVVWQLWWTDVVADRGQAEIVEELDWAWPGGQAAAQDPVDEPTEPTEPAEPVQRHDPAPVLAEPGHLTTFATLRVPRWGADYVRPISQGTSRADVLDVLGIGHYEGTAMPGAVGNFAVAAHRTTYGKPFNRVAELQTGDPLVVQTEDTWYVYRVTSTEVVTPRDVQVIAPVPNDPGAEPTTAMMTLTTCHPMFSARERFIVHAELDYWLPVADGTPLELTGGA